MTDLADILIHCGVAVAIVLVCWALGWPWAGAIFAGLAFLAREAQQDHSKVGRWRWPHTWSIQKRLEAGAPIVAALIAGAALSAVA